jgi:uncharacterized protein YndB with AHSA1/START domain
MPSMLCGTSPAPLSRRAVLGLIASSPLLTVLSAPAAIAAIAAPGRADPAPLTHALRPGTWGDLQHHREPLMMSAVLRASPARVFATLAAPEPWPRWLSLVQQVRYRSDARGVGCERDVTTAGGVVIREHFIAWEPGQRLAFFVSSSTSSALAMFMEDYALFPIAGGHTRLRWTVAFELQPPFSTASSVFGAVFRQEAEVGLRRLDALLRG